MVASLLDTPLEILQKIVLFAVTSVGPPTEFYSLLLLCRATHRNLTQNSSDFYARIFAQKFDIGAPTRHLRDDRDVIAENAGLELRRRFNVLKGFRQGRLDDASSPQALWVAYFMMLEDDGRNFSQLQWAGLPTLLKMFLRQHLYRGSELNNGWPVENQTNSLVIALLWLLSSKASVQDEGPKERDEIMDLLRPYALAAFRYPCFNSPEYPFDSMEINCIGRPPITTVHGPYPPQRIQYHEVPYFGRIFRNCQPPSIAVSAILCYTTRHETRIPMIPVHLAKNRSEAVASGRLGPTRDDVEHYIAECQTHFVTAALSDQSISCPGSHKHDMDWLRVCGEPSYKPGTLTGSWQGSFIQPCAFQYGSWLSNLTIPSPFPEFGRQPLYFTLREHFCYSPSRIPLDKAENGMMNAWLPSGCQWAECGNGIEVFDKQGTFNVFYETYQRGPSGDDETKYRDVVDVIVTGRPDDRYAAAWGAYNIIGRVRLSDGLVVLARESLAGLGTTLFRGYVTSSQNLVGRFRGVSPGAEPAEWESTFSLCKATSLQLTGVQTCGSDPSV